MVNFKGGNLKSELISPKSVNNLHDLKSPKDGREINSFNPNLNLARSNSTKNKKEKLYKK